MTSLILTIKTSSDAILANKGRSILTTLGVIIGVFSVVMMISLGQGVQNYITDEFEAIGSNLIFIVPGQAGFGDPAESFSRNQLEQKHINLISTYASDYVTSVIPYHIVGDNVKFKTKTFYAEVIGVNYQSLEVFNYSLAEGTNFTQSQEKSGARVAIIGPLVRDELFSNQSPLDKRISIGGDNYTVIGVFSEKGSNYDDQIILPYTSAEDTFDLKNYSSIVAKINDSQNVDVALRHIELALLRDLKKDDFTVMSQEDILSTIQETLGVLTLGLGLIAGISLVVGGIGIMNIMLVSVTERIKEIGLRKALGATSKTIALQFLIESIMLSVLGGLLGLILGYIGTGIAQQFLRAEIPIGAVFLSFGFSAFVGMVFGTYPALSASRKDPIESLRYE